jgi:hypothetical protein
MMKMIWQVLKNQKMPGLHLILMGPIAELGIEESVKKSNPLSEIMTFLWMLFNSTDLTIRVTDERLVV